MIRSTASKVMWVRRATVLPVGLIAVIVAIALVSILSLLDAKSAGAQKVARNPLVAWGGNYDGQA
jgi:hypothetical protein